VNVRRFIRLMCARFGVSRDFGRRLQPLVQKAAESPPEKRRLLLQMVERSFEEEARRAVRELAGEKDRRALTNVARLLHGWTPPTWLDDWDDFPPLTDRS
jgi:hypothetical protein